MQSRPEIESDSHRIHEVDVHIPYRKVFRLIAITLILQAIGTLAIAYSVGKTDAAQLVDIGTMLSIAVFVCGALMWGRFEVGSSQRKFSNFLICFSHHNKLHRVRLPGNLSPEIGIMPKAYVCLHQFNPDSQTRISLVPRVHLLQM